jgi:hypothetical protein
MLLIDIDGHSCVAHSATAEYMLVKFCCGMHCRDNAFRENSVAVLTMSHTHSTGRQG